MKSRLSALATAIALAITGFSGAPAFAEDPDGDASPEVVVDWRVSEDTGAEFHVAATLHNNTDAPMSGWSIESPYRHTVIRVDGGVSVQDDSTLTINGEHDIAVGAAQVVHLVVASAGPVSRVPSTCTSEAIDCRVVVPGDSIDLGSDEPEQEADSDPPEITESTSPSDGSALQGPTVAPLPEVPDLPEVLDSGPSVEQPDQSPGPLPEPSRSTTMADSLPPEADRVDAGQVDPDSPGPGPVPASSTPDPAVELAHPEASLTVAVVVTSDWGLGQSVKLTVRNDGPDAIDEWAIVLPLEISVESMWNAESTSGGGVIRASNAQWNGHLEAGEAVEIGFNGSPGASVFAEGGCLAQTTHGTASCQLLK
jgi:hypothetical protein